MRHFQSLRVFGAVYDSEVRFERFEYGEASASRPYHELKRRIGEQATHLVHQCNSGAHGTVMTAADAEVFVRRVDETAKKLREL